jgi:hypothetical protein
MNISTTFNRKKYSVWFDHDEVLDTAYIDLIDETNATLLNVYPELDIDDDLRYEIADDLVAKAVKAWCLV